MVSLLEAKKSVECVLMARDDVIGVGIDYTDNTIKVYVNESVGANLLPLPTNIAGYAVKIVDMPGFKPTSSKGSYRAMRFRPVVGGVSASHPEVTAGTVGAIIRDNVTGNKLFLSNNHVFANSASLTNGRANEGDPIYQPGCYDIGGCSYSNTEDVVATLYKWIPFDDSGMNIVDAALALPLDQNLASPYLLTDSSLDLIPINGVRSVSSPIKIKKYGRTTGADTGDVIDWNFTVAVDYDDGKTRNFTDQILTTARTEGGDSGSILLDENNNAVGLIFAGGQDLLGGNYGVANKIQNVLAMFGRTDVDISNGWSSADWVDPMPVFKVEQ
jgi:hypothetical protein